MEILRERKGPGRPRKPIDHVPIPIYGVVAAPVDDGSYLELVCCNPRLFKRIHSLYKGYESSELDIVFETQQMVINALDHLGKVRIHSIINGKKMNLYYCQAPVTLCIKRLCLDKIFAALDNVHTKIQFRLRKDTYRSLLYITTIDSEYESVDDYSIDVMFKEQSRQAEETVNTADYALKCTMSGRHLKKKINDISKLDDVLTIQKIGTQPLLLTSPKAININYNGQYPNAAKIALMSRIADGDMLSSSVNIKYIKPFTSANIGLSIDMAVDKIRPIVLTTYCDEIAGEWAAKVEICADLEK